MGGAHRKFNKPINNNISTHVSINQVSSGLKVTLSSYDLEASPAIKFLQWDIGAGAFGEINKYYH